MMLDRLWSGESATLRVTALDMLRANVMIADKELNIIYMNPAVVGLMQQAEADLKRELPRFSVATLIGSNIDVFHKSPSHQRTMLASLEKPHGATIRIGQWVFDLLVTPLSDKGKRAGFVVEWSDARHRLLNVDYAAQMTAISRSQAVIEFTVEGIILEANENFLRALGYTIEEVRGKHHRTFVERGFEESAEYRTFWDKLRRGEYQAGQYKRVAKNGKEVWIEGAYNPILDTSGKVCKVVKFAADITPQMKLLADLKILIDQNFGEIDGAIGLSTSEARSASSAATEMSSNVQAVAVSAEQLSASAAEISRSMTKSRTSIEGVFEQSVAVGQSTQTLATAAQAMSGIVGLIRNVASQINLLALNATIEAARAGEAGKGFAVVASEVKNLAIQAAKATEQISSEIDAIQATSIDVASALAQIRAAVTSVREQVTLTASAVEEQNAVTHGMSVNMQNASGAVGTVTANIVEISAAVLQAAQAVAKTKQAAQVLVR